MFASFYKGSHGIVLVYSIDSRETFNNIEKWVKQI